MPVFEKYFPLLAIDQKEKLRSLQQIYARWNLMINVISRKDMDNFTVHHVLHSLSLAKTFSFLPGTTVLDAGTGGGFPGIPLAIVFPGAHFTLLDSTGKKIKVVSAVAEELGLKNVTAVQKRIEDEHVRYNYVVSRAVTAFTDFVKLTSKNVKPRDGNNGIICLKGGDIAQELGSYLDRSKIWNSADFFDEPYFETKKIVWLPF
jgi:16S rRNA (guanine527-N7)-methyltransferase